MKLAITASLALWDDTRTHCVVLFWPSEFWSALGVSGSSVSRIMLSFGVLWRAVIASKGVGACRIAQSKFK